MCGIVGLVLSKRSRSREEILTARRIFERLLLTNESRGPFATGVCGVTREGEMLIVKEPIRASVFTTRKTYLRWKRSITQRSVILLGHTRYPTRGSVRNNANNHPLVAGHCIVVHNGTLMNVDHLFAQYYLPRHAEVDSEFLVQLAERHGGPSGLELNAYLNDLAASFGKLTAAVLDTRNPGTLHLLHGNMPIEIRIHRAAGILAFASVMGEADPLRLTEGWEALLLPTFTALTVMAEEEFRWDIQPFSMLNDR